MTYWTGKADEFATCDPSQWPDDLELSVDVVGIGNREQALSHLALVGNLQEKLNSLLGGRADGPFVTADNIANAAQKLAELLGYRTPGMFFQPPGRAVAAAGHSAGLLPDPAVLAAQAQIEIQQAAAAADIDIKRHKVWSDIAIAAFKAQQWAEIERFKAGAKATLERSSTTSR